MKNNKIILSVVVVTYNQLELLRQTIDSIVRQEATYFFEIIVADDCSTDGTKEYCESLKSADGYNIKYVRMVENGGITANCNLGLSHAQGKYVTLIGGDDLFLPFKIQMHIDYMENNPDVVISYHPVDIFDSKTDETLILTNQSNVDTPLSVLEIIELCIPGSVSVIARSDALPVGGFDARLPIVSDWLYYIEIAAKGKVGFIQDKLARYRKHGNQASSRTYELLDESLRNLDLAKEKLPTLIGIDDAIASGKSRYILGEAFRKYSAGESLTARKLILRALSFKKTFSAYGLFLMTFAPASILSGQKIKKFLKRIF